MCLGQGVGALAQAVSGRILYGIGRLKWATIVIVGAALANLTISILLVGPLGIEGVALGTAIPVVLADVILACYTCRILDVPIRRYLRRSHLNPLLVAPIAPVVWLVLSQSNPVTSWGSFILVGCSGTLAYAVVAIMVELEPTVADLKRFVLGARITPADSPEPPVVSE